MTIRDWLEITITFNAKCNECGKDILPGKTFWSTSKAARHLSCSNNKIDNQINKTPNVIVAQDIVETDGVHLVKCDLIIMELSCFVCETKTGCNECKYLADYEGELSRNIVYVMKVAANKRNL